MKLNCCCGDLERRNLPEHGQSDFPIQPMRLSFRRPVCNHISSELLESLTLGLCPSNTTLPIDAIGGAAVQSLLMACSVN